MGKQLRTDSLPLTCGARIRVANERDITDMLKSHYSEENSIFERAPEYNSIIDFFTQLGGGHVGFLPPIRRNVFTIDRCCVVDHVAHSVELLRAALPDYHQFSLRF